MAEWNERLSASLRQSQTFRLFTVAVLVLLLLIPIGMIRGLVTERKERQASAIDEVTSKWGRVQHIIGPFLVVPYTYDVVEPQQSGGPIVRRIEQHAVFLADALKTRATIATETRSRGIYSVPVYKMDLVATGTFSRPDFSVLGVVPSSVEWERVQLVLGISDTRAIQERSSVTWNGAQVPMIPGSGPYLATQPGTTQWLVSRRARQSEFLVSLALNGSQGAHFVPFGESSANSSNYPHPFPGELAAGHRERGKADSRRHGPFHSLMQFSAGVGGGRRRLADIAADSRFGVEFVDPVDRYSMAERSVKYAGLFILLTFATLWLFEVRAAARVHPIQFLMLGGALCLFYLLLLSLSEHIPFIGAYAVASIAVIAMVRLRRHRSRATFTCSCDWRRGRDAVWLPYVLLVNEDYALLIDR
jgi:inner membrane protein